MATLITKLIRSLSTTNTIECHPDTEEINSQGIIQCYKTQGRKLFKVPSLDNGNSRPTHTIFIIDRSPSMYQFINNGVNQLTNEIIERANLFGRSSYIYFSTENILVKNKPLTEPEIKKKLTTSQTDIIGAINVAKKQITSLRNSTPNMLIKILFISDGDDTCHSSTTFNDLLNKLTDNFDCLNIGFTSIGIGKEFPTHVAMILKNQFNAVYENIQGVQIVTTIEEYGKALTWTLNEQMIDVSNYAVSFPVHVALWSEPRRNLESDSICFVDEYVDELELICTKCNKKRLFKLINSKLTFEFTEKVIRQYINIIHGLSYTNINQTELRKYALITRNFAIQLLEDTKSYARSINNLIDKVMAKTQRHLMYEIESKLISELTKMCDGSFASTLTPHEAAIRMDIQRDISQMKHLDRKLRRHGVSRENWPAVVSNFQESIQKSSFQEKLKSLTEEDWAGCRCDVTFISPADSLLSPDFLTALDLINDPYELIMHLECLPPGFGVKIDYNETMTHEPYTIRITSMVKHVNMISYNKLLTDGVDRMCKLNIGQNEYEEFNATVLVMPANLANIFAPFLRHQLLTLLLTYTVQQTADIMDQNAHLGALAACIMYLVQQPHHGFRDERIKLIKDTFNYIYRGLGDYPCRTDIKEYSNLITNMPKMAAVSEHHSLQTKFGLGAKCPSLAKLALFLVCCEELCTETKIELYLQLFRETVGRIANGEEATKFFTIDCKSICIRTDITNVIKEEIGDLAMYYTWNECSKMIEENVSKCNISVQGNVKLKMNVLTDRRMNKLGSIDFCSLSALRKYLFADNELEIIEDYIKNYIVSMVYHGLHYSSSYNRVCTELNSHEAAIDNIHKILACKEITELRYALSEHLKIELKPMHKLSMQNRHHGTCKPMTLNEISHLPDVQNCIQNGKINANNLSNQIKYNLKTGLALYICACESCPHFGIFRHDSAQHFELVESDNNFIKALHKTVLKYKNLSQEEIYEIAIQGMECFNGNNDTENFAIINRDEILHDISVIKQFYLKHN